MDNTDRLYKLISDVNASEIGEQVQVGNLAGWCSAWRMAALEEVKQPTMCGGEIAKGEKE